MKDSFDPQKYGTKTSFEEKKKKLQGFYNDWVKPMKDIMPLQMFLDCEDIIKKYSLIK